MHFIDDLFQNFERPVLKKLRLSMLNFKIRLFIIESKLIKKDLKTVVLVWEIKVQIIVSKVWNRFEIELIVINSI